MMKEFIAYLSEQMGVPALREAGVANTCGGAGAHCGIGGSGIVIIRNAR